MLEAVEKPGLSPRITKETSGNLHRRLKTGYFILEALNALAAAYYFNYLFFYMQEHFGFGNRSNLLLTAQYGFLYMFAAWTAGRLAQKYGYFFFLRLGFSVVLAAMVLGGLIPRALDYSRAAMFSEFGILMVWTLGMCVTWPTLQALVSQNESPGVASRTAGVYNIIWAVAAAVAYLTGGALLDRFGGETLFWVSAGLHLGQLVLLGRLQKMSALPAASAPVINAKTEITPSLNPRPIAKARTFLRLAWIANPFAYVAIYGMLPVVPKLSEQLGLSPTYAGFIYSTWFWVRLGAFVWFWLWPG
ncbi:MAG TPA: MFS transporter, partial [Verrucomicrobiae bacterium]|nr:MFS transporter [Verrucomicrobiae bacterium]